MPPTILWVLSELAVGTLPANGRIDALMTARERGHAMQREEERNHEFRASQLLSLDELLTPQQAAAYLGLQTATLQRQRTEGTGPPFVRVSKRRVAYRAADLRNWLETRVAQSTADARVRGLAT